MTHELKTWPEYFEKILNNEKNFEVRANDRNFKQGDILRLNEYDPEQGDYTGRSILRKVCFVLYGGKFGIKSGYCVMSIS